MLEKLKLPNDIKKLNEKQLKKISNEIRIFLLKTLSKTGGHLASNLGVVELTLALMKTFDFPKDSIVWDVGHQSYVYKMLTGRIDEFEHLREMGHMCGFPSREESEYDIFGTGHSSTSIAAANGIATAKRLSNDNSHTIAVIGDGAITGGLALEGLNNIVSSNGNRLIVILNDNEMSIDDNIGAANHIFSKIRISKNYNNIKNNIIKKLENMSFLGDELYKGISRIKGVVKQALMPEVKMETLGLKYYGPIDGHNISELCDVLEYVKSIDSPVMVHIKTKKGKGYKYAVEQPSKYHGVNPFNPASGETISNKAKTYTDVFEEALFECAKDDEDIVAISAAMVSSTGLNKMKKNYPDRVFDVGIAEQYAVTFAAGMTCKNKKPVVAIYSTFLQRAYDQILHDVCLQKLPVIFAIDRAGIVGKDGATHQGLFDITYLNTLPNMNIIAPINDIELKKAVNYACSLGKPIAIRYPRGNATDRLSDVIEDYEYGKGQILRKGKDIAIVAAGTMVHTAMEVADKFKECKNLNISVINPRFLKPFDTDILDEIAKRSKIIVTIEEGIISGGFGRNVGNYLTDNYDIKVINIGIDNKFVPHGDVEELKEKFGLDSDSIYNKIFDEWSKFENKA